MTKKANGVYYTPSAVVDYIVRSTLVPLLEHKSPMQIAGRTEDGECDEAAHAMAILDPACGSGYFLLGAYQYLLDWCFEWYCEHEPERWLSGPRPTLCRVGSSLCLLGQERRRILREHLFGVDIDEQAIEIAKHSLRLKATADDGGQRAADGSDNIRCGNSLIGSDFLASGAHGALVDSRSTICTFDWEDEFSAVMASGGFDAIVGNPPYVNTRIVKQEQGEAVKKYFRQRYRCARRAFDLYVLFVERSQELLRAGGRAGLIVPNKIATLDYARPCRELLLEETTLDTVTDVSDQQLFRDASVYPYIITWTKRLPAADHHVRIESSIESRDMSRADSSRRVRQAAWSAQTGIAIHETLDVESRVSTQPLSQRGSIHSGTTGFCAERMAQALTELEPGGNDKAFDFIVSGNIDRYEITRGTARFMKRVFARPVLPIDSDVLTDNKRELFSRAKIVIAGMSRRLEAAWDAGGLALGVQVYAVANFQDDPRFLLGVLNSRLMSYLLLTRFQAKRLAGGYLAINKGQLAQLPIRIVDQVDKAAVSLRLDIIEFVDRMTRRDHSTEDIDGRIDDRVYKLYQLTSSEIRAVELTVSEEPPRAR